MRLHSLSALLGIATVAIVAAAPVQAAPSTYQVGSGTTSLQLDKAALDALTSLGLKFDSSFGTVPAATGFGLGFAINPSTDFRFSYDATTQAFAPVSGTIEHSGGIKFAVDEAKLSYPSSLEVGDFSIGFDQGFFLRDTLTTGLRLFDLTPTGAPTLAEGILTVPGFDVKVAQQFNDSLSAATIAGTDLGLTGAKLGTAKLVAKKVPEPGVVLGLLAVTGTLLAAKGRRLNKCLNLTSQTDRSST